MSFREENSTWHFKLWVLVVCKSLRYSFTITFWKKWRFSVQHCFVRNTLINKMRNPIWLLSMRANDCWNIFCLFNSIQVALLRNERAPSKDSANLFCPLISRSAQFTIWTSFLRDILVFSFLRRSSTIPRAIICIWFSNFLKRGQW